MQDRPDLLFIEASLLHIRFTSNLTNINFLLRNKSFVQKGFQNWISTVSLRYQILLDTLIRFLITEFLLLPSVHQFHGQIQVCTENPPGVRIFTCHGKYQLWCPPLSSTDTPAGPLTQTAHRQIHCQWRVQHSAHTWREDVTVWPPTGLWHTVMRSVSPCPAELHCWLISPV